VLGIVESVEKKFGVAETQLDSESPMPKTQETTNSLIKIPKNS
jgi:hypothetical protein